MPMFVLAFALLAALALAGPAQTAAPSEPRLHGVRTWALALGSGTLEGDVARRLEPFDLVVVDGQEARPAQVAALRGRGKIVLAYLSVGTIEPQRPWYRRARPHRLDRYEEFGEFYADTSRAAYRRLIARGVAPPMLAKGFDGLFLDNTDMIETHPRQAPGMRLLVADLARLVHGRRGLLFTQNGEGVIGRMLRHYDGWNREDVSWTYDFARRRYARVPAARRRAALAALRRFAAAGLLVTATDYLRAGDTPAARESAAAACAAGALPFASDIGLRRLARVPLRCP